MRLSATRLIALSAFLVAAFAALAAEQDKAPSPPAKKAAPGLDDLKLPPGAVVVICEKTADALRLVPKGIIIAPEKHAEYEALRAEVERLKARLLRPDRLASPGTCVLKGKVEGNAAQLQAQFFFDTTNRPDVLVPLACGQAKITAATLGDQTPMLRLDADGYTVRVETPGKQTLNLDLVVPLTFRGGDRTLELDLPRASITSLGLDLPAGARDIRVGGKAATGAPATAVKGNRLEADLGAVARLDVSWKDPGAGGGTSPLLSVEGRVLVRVDARQATSTAELTLRTQGGQVKEWRLLVPPGAEVKAAAADEARIVAIDPPGPAEAVLRTIRLKEADPLPLKVTVTTRAGPPRSGSRTPVGPFIVLGAVQPKITVLVTNAASDFRMRLLPHADLVRGEAPPDPSVTAAFTYQPSAPPDRPPPAGVPLPAWLEIEMENVRGLLETRVTHALKLQRVAGRVAWRLSTIIDATPIRSGGDRLTIQLPPDFEYDAAVGPRPADVVRDVENEPANRLVFRLGDEPLKPFQLTFSGSYRQQFDDTGRATLTLPRPQDVRDRGGEVSVTSRDFELTAPAGGNAGLELTGQDPQRIAWHSEHLPERVEAAWRPYRPEVRATAVVDLTLGAREADVRHEIRFQFPRTLPGRVALRVPEALLRTLSIEGGALREPDAPGAPVREVELRGVSGKDHTLLLKYFLPLPRRTNGDPLTVPLVVPEPAESIETKVRVWSEPETMPVPVGGAWSEVNIEEVKGIDRLPALVLRAPRADTPLVLRLEPPAGGAGATVLVERALVRASLDEGGQTYHASFLVRHLTSPQLEVELPAALFGLRLRVALNGKEVAWTVSPDDSRVARLNLAPELVRKPSSLEIRYQLPSADTGSGFVQSVLQPPLLRGAPSHVPTRWEINLPSSWIVLGPETGPGVERAWARRGWLLASRPALTPTALERWFAGPDLFPRAVPTETPASHVCARSGVGLVRLTHVPNLVWQLICSLGLIVVGLSLGQLSRRNGDDPLRPSPWFLPALGILTLSVAGVWLLFPTLLAAILYGSQAGVLVLAVIFLFEGIKRERYRRQVVFLSSFSRGRKGSSQARTIGSSVRRRREPSTVDAPPAVGIPPEGGNS
jgi:hypothetical protein